MKKILAVIAVTFCALSIVSCSKEVTFTESIIGTSWTAKALNGDIVFEFVSSTNIRAYFLSYSGDKIGETDGTYRICEEGGYGFIDISSLKVKAGHQIYDFAHRVSSVFKHTASNGDYFNIRCATGIVFADNETTLMFFKN